jgi:hypothetical protein
VLAKKPELFSSANSGASMQVGMSPTPMPTWLSLPDAAELAHVDVEALRAAIAQGDLHPRKFGSTSKIVDAELMQWLQRRQFQHPSQRGRAASDRASGTRQTSGGTRAGAEGGASHKESPDEFSVDDWLRQTSYPGQSPS